MSEDEVAAAVEWQAEEVAAAPPRLVQGHVLADGTLARFVHVCPGEGCAVRRYLEDQWWRAGLQTARGRTA